jgi:hypothetical protein
MFSPVYLNALLAMLNGRQRLRENLDTGAAVTIRLSEIAPVDQNSSEQGPRQRRNNQVRRCSLRTQGYVMLHLYYLFRSRVLLKKV